MEELLERSLAIKEREYGSDHVEVAITLTNLACAIGSLRNHLHAYRPGDILHWEGKGAGKGSGPHVGLHGNPLTDIK